MPSRNRKSQRDFDPELYEEDDFEASPGTSREQVRQLIRDLLVRWHWIALILIMGILAAFYYLSKAPKIYEATSTLLVKQGASTVISGEDDEPLDLRSNDAVNTVAQRVKRLELLTAVASLPEVAGIENLVPGPTNWFPGWAQSWLGESGGEVTKPQNPAELGRIIGQWTDVNVRRNTRLLDITVSHPSPDVAKLLADAIANEYIAELTGDRADGRDSSTKILTNQSEQARLKLQVAQNALANYKQILETLKGLEDKEGIFSELDRRYLPKHPKHMVAKATLDQFQKRFLSEFELVHKAAADKVYWESTRAEWDQPSLDVATRIQITRRLLTARATVLQSEIQSQNEVFNTILTKIQEADINKEATEAEVELSNLSQLPTNPASPKKGIVLAGGGFLGFGVGLAFAFLLLKLDNVIHTVGQAELLTNIPVLATIRDIDPKILAEIISKKGGQGVQAAAAKNWDQRFVFREGLSDTLYAEMFRILRASVTLLGDETKRNITLFSSALPSEGKTLVSSNFAIASAQQGKKTVLVDLDLRKPKVHVGFGLKRSDLKKGITELLAGQIDWRDAVESETGQENLSCIFAGVKAPNPGELLDSETISALFEELGKEFDVIVVDSAPLLVVPDTRLLIPIVDNFCLVVRAEKTPKKALKKVIDLMDDDGTTPSGIVINGFEEKKGLFNYNKYGYGYSGYGGYGQYGKGYGYGSYGAYGSDAEDD